MWLAIAVMMTVVSWFGGPASPSAAQPRVVRAFDEFEVTVGPEQDPDDTWFRVDWKNGRVSEFLVPQVFDAARLARDLTAYQGHRLIIRAGRGSIVIVDPVSGAVVDRFITLRSTESPDGRYLAIERYSPNVVAFHDSVYSIYDLQKTPEENGPRKAGDASAGWIVYPPPNVVAQSYSQARRERDAHDLLSSLTWLGPHLLAFLDHHAGGVTLVVVDVEAGVNRARTSQATLDLPRLLTTDAEADSPRLLRVSSIGTASDSADAISLRLLFEPARFLRVTDVVVRVRRAR
jgi:hypothetical protein